MRRLRKGVRKTTTSPEGQHVQSAGVRVGYWPCLKAPFVQIAVGNRVIDIWYGGPTRKTQKECVD